MKASYKFLNEVDEKVDLSKSFTVEEAEEIGNKLGIDWDKS